MLGLALKQVLAHKLRLALTVLAVALGVAFATGSLVLTDTSTRLFDEQFATATSGADLTVTTAVAFDSGMGVEVERDPLPAALASRIAAVDGVGSTIGTASGSGLIVRNGQPITPSGASTLSSWTGTAGPYQLRSGQEPRRSGEVAIDAATAQAHGIVIGDTLQVQARRTGSLRVVGLVGFGDQAGIPNSTVALTSLDQAQRLLKLPDQLTAVQVTAASGTNPAQLRDRVAEQVGARYAVSLSRDTAAAGVAAAKDRLAYLKVMLVALAGAALLIGGYLIANTFSIVVSQRTRELAVLRAAGASARQVAAMVLGEAVLVGTIGSLVGVAGGVLAAIGLRDLAGGFGVAVPDGRITVLPRSLIIALGVGVLVTIIAAAGPSRRAAAVSPLQALRDAAAVTVMSRGRIIAGCAFSAVALTAGLAVLVIEAPLPVVGVAAVGTVVALSLLGPVLAPYAVRAVAWPLRRRSVTGRLGAEFAARSPRRTAATVLALGLSLALVAFITVLAGSIRSSIAGTYREVVTADFVIESARGEMLGGLAPDVHHHVMDLPEVAVAARTQYGHWKDGDMVSALTAVDPETIAAVTSIQPLAGDLASLETGGVVIADHVARERGIGLGDGLPMTFARVGRKSLPVVGVIGDNDARALSTDFLVSLDTYRTLYTEEMDASVFITIADGVTPAGAEAAISSALKDFPTAELRDQQEAIAGRTATIDQILGLVTVLLLFTVVMATLGITNTLALSIVERTRELGLLRAVGMSRRQARSMVRSESVLLAALAGLLGVAAGVGFAALAVAVFGRTGEITLVVPAGRVALVAGVALAAGLLAALLPARRVARLQVLDAISAR